MLSSQPERKRQGLHAPMSWNRACVSAGKRLDIVAAPFAACHPCQSGQNSADTIAKTMMMMMMMMTMSANLFVRMKMPISLRIAPISSSHSEMIRRIIVMTISGEPDCAEHAQHQQINNVESISHSCVSSSDRDEFA